MKKVVMFTQTTCGPCKQLKPHLKAATDQLNMQLEEVNVQDDWDLAVKNGVKSTPTVVVVEDDKQLTTVGARTTLALIKELEPYAEQS